MKSKNYIIFTLILILVGCGESNLSTEEKSSVSVNHTTNISSKMEKLEYGYLNETIYKIKNDTLWYSIDDGNSWSQKKFNTSIQDSLIDGNKLVLLLNNFELHTTTNFIDYSFTSNLPKLKIAQST